ncbi:MAG TPA: diguanylate phosphodiesterase [Thermoanaerobaculia bacterium]|nr:diguanylate phosphodiesterase [Thermoanaerobaculia bacterium]
MSAGRSYISQAREEQQQYVNALLRENEKLRGAVAVAEEQHRAAASELERLRARFDEVAGENQRFAEQYQYIEEQSSNLANLYVASYQLHTSVDRDAVLTAIQEIVINLIGSEQLAIYEHDGSAFRLAAQFGLDDERLATRIAGTHAVQKLGEGHVFDADPQPLTASVPLRIGERVIGAILVFRLLEHKLSLEVVDHELFDLLAVHASTALYCASLHAQTAVAG